MKCLLVSDLHYTLKQFDWVLQQAPAYDVVVIAGDHLDIASAVDLQVQITVILSYLKRMCAKTRVVVCSGNHDLDARDFHDEKYARWILMTRQFGIPTDEDSLELEDILFTICPWWDGPKRCARVGEQIERDSRKTKAQWIWIYHAPPDASPTSWSGRRYGGDAQLVEWIARFAPSMVLVGHVHQSPFQQGGSWVDRIGGTWVFNPGRQLGPVPAHIILDTQARRALWASCEVVEEIALDAMAPLRPRPVREAPAWLDKRYCG